MAKKNYPFFEVEISKNYPSGISTHIDWKPSTNIVETGDALVIEMELPGVAKSDVSITLLNNQELIVKGLKKQPRLEQEPVTYYLFEREFGTFRRDVVVPGAVDPDRACAALENGVLTVTVPKAEQAKPRKIQIS